MSWQTHVDNLLADKVIQHAAIIGIDGSVWAKSGAFNMTPGELQTFAANFSKHEFFQSNGITLAGTRYIFLSGAERVVRGKKDKSGIHCFKTEKGIIISVYTEPTAPPQAAGVVEKLGEYLISTGF